ncbi:hypothetical protein O181_111555 [Austropuccinia psidii MF-1]|uniref:Uncharacterized protein n=1 Tax=Austropuccinia psidii MF-1 TaxID=1389203 RepID=A0A9Q3K2M7_9BASI|nr:hypothetical protein [Austropuccinia psidii MF-1]
MATQRSRKPKIPASIQGKPALTTCTGNITGINPVVTSKGKFPKALESRFVQDTVKGTLELQGTSQRQARTVQSQKTRVWKTWQIIPTLPFTFQFNGNLKTEDFKYIDQALQLHKLWKHLFQWRMDKKNHEQSGNTC